MSWPGGQAYCLPACLLLPATFSLGLLVSWPGGQAYSLPARLPATACYCQPRHIGELACLSATASLCGHQDGWPQQLARSISEAQTPSSYLHPQTLGLTAAKPCASPPQNPVPHHRKTLGLTTAKPWASPLQNPGPHHLKTLGGGGVTGPSHAAMFLAGKHHTCLPPAPLPTPACAQACP